MADVIIPAYRADWCLEECIHSIEAQTAMPERVLIGIDACEDTAIESLMIQEDSPLDIDLYWFPKHSGPFRIRNTLALISLAEIVTTFDADDIMWPKHIETMAAIADETHFAMADAMMVRDDNEPMRWNRAHGVIAITRKNFIRMGGYEAWDCGGDTEGLYRWQKCGLLMVKPENPTMTVRKHDRGVTAHPETGYKSQKRRDYKLEILRRMDTPIRLDRIAIAPCFPLNEAALGMIGEPGYADLPTSLPIPAGKCETSNRELEAAATIRGLLRHYDRGYEREQRRAWKRAEQWLGGRA